jgi:trans-aconitate methyltransferase
MEYLFLFITLIIIILLIIYFTIARSLSIPVVEGFEDKFDNFENYEEIYDREFIDFYEIIYRNFLYIDHDFDIVYEKTVKDNYHTKFMVAGSGVGKLCKKIKDKDISVIGVDISESMLKKSQFMYPNIKFVRANLMKQSIFERNSFTHIFIDDKTLYYNEFQDMRKIIFNIYGWLIDDGYLIMQIYNPKKLRLVPRYYSSNYIDDKGNTHGFTYLNDFSHDCYVLPDEKQKNVYNYYDKIVFEDGKKRIKKTTYYIPPIEDMYDMIMSTQFELFYKDLERPKNVSGYELAIFKKKSEKVTVDELENK